MNIGGYFKFNYHRLLVIIILMAIGEFFIGEYWWFLVAIVGYFTLYYHMLLLDFIGYFILGHYIIYYIILNCYTYDK